MKRLITIALLSCALATSVTSCKNPQATAYKVEGVTITTVDNGMKFWHDWVLAGKATQAQMDLVKAAYQKYYAAQQVAKGALEYYVSATSTNTLTAAADAARARQAVTDAESALLSLIQLFATKK